ncbi:hypothetical protein SDC9_109542 [bioreactor metagenome]|uniref:Uncharacterized protein n=1 Tax=bioreactor metagenome TaxID=1076179 RepID=A0A645BB39_9ZZZZ
MVIHSFPFEPDYLIFYRNGTAALFQVEIGEAKNDFLVLIVNVTDAQYVTVKHMADVGGKSVVAAGLAVYILPKGSGTFGHIEEVLLDFGDELGLESVPGKDIHPEIIADKCIGNGHLGIGDGGVAVRPEFIGQFFPQGRITLRGCDVEKESVVLANFGNLVGYP